MKLYDSPLGKFVFILLALLFGALGSWLTYFLGSQLRYDKGLAAVQIGDPYEAMVRHMGEPDSVRTGAPTDFRWENEKAKSEDEIVVKECEYVVVGFPYKIFYVFSFNKSDRVVKKARLD